MFNLGVCTGLFVAGVCGVWFVLIALPFIIAFLTASQLSK